MKIQIIGLGIVGTAQAFLARNLGHEVFGKDPNKKESDYCTIIESYRKEVDITFICCPEKYSEQIIKEIAEEKIEGIIVIKSTVPIGTIKTLEEKYKVRLSHNPEFLKEDTYLDDVLNPEMIVIGTEYKEHKDLLVSFYHSMNKPIIITNTRTSELVKLTLNSYLALQITFWNEIDILCKEKNINTKELSNITAYDSRVSNYGRSFFGKPYNKKCLPKDVRHLISAFKNIGQKTIFEECENFNNNL